MSLSSNKELSMKILIAGGAGFIGSHIAEYFQNICDVRILDNYRSGFRHNVENLNVEIIKGSIMDRDLVKKVMSDIDYVFHLAAIVSVPESVENPIECVNINTIGLLTVLEEASRANVKKLCLSSSSAIYGNNPSIPKSEDMLPEPISPYAITKLDGEYFCKEFNDEDRLQTVCLRYFNVFGPRQNPKSQYAAAVPIFINQALTGKPLTIYGDGKQTRDFIYVKDIVAANEHVTISTESNEIYNVAYGHRITINDLAEKIIQLTNSNSEILHLPERPGDVKHSVASIDAIESTGFKASHTFEDALNETIEFYHV